MKSTIRHVLDGDLRYDALLFVCPGCLEFGGSGLHMLPVNSNEKRPSWTWDGNLEKPTLSPSILTRQGEGKVHICHSFLKEGVFDYLLDCTHSLAGHKVNMIDLYDWVINDT